MKFRLRKYGGRWYPQAKRLFRWKVIDYDLDVLPYHSREEAITNKYAVQIGFQPEEQKWYGWSHRAIFGYGIGYVAKRGHVATESGWVPEYLEEHPEKDLRVPVGFECKTLEDCKRCAIAHAESVG